MSVLAPLFFFVGAAAVSLPILFHLIRRTPRGRQTFSSLMFLTPSPPRLTRRSRIENWLLLLLRAAALVLLALAFARPFLRQVANMSFDGVRGRRVAILLDTSASMRRDGIWQDANAALERLLSGLDPADELALYTFDRNVDAQVPFSDDSITQQQAVKDVVRETAKRLVPTWHHSDLGNALVSVAEELTLESGHPDRNAVSQIVVISDMQEGVDLRAIQEYEWPKEVLVTIDTVEPADPSNATLALLRVEEEAAAADTVRVRVANADGSMAEQFQIEWSVAEPIASDDSSGDTRPTSNDSGDDQVAIYVPAGQSRVVRLAKPEMRTAEQEDIASVATAHSIVLSGDAAEFDNTFYVVPQLRDEVEFLYVGTDKERDPSGLHYYLELALGETPRRKVNLSFERPSETLANLSEKTRMVAVTAALPASSMKQVDGYVRAGGTALFVPRDEAAAKAVATEFEYLEHIAAKSGTRDDYLLLVDIDFGHSVFKPFATARYSDFTKIHFWRHQRFELASEHTAHVIAAFDNGDPAIWEQKHGEGAIYVFASGWHPDDSQLALSTKFVPLLNTMLEQAAGTPIDLPSYVVGEAVPLPETTGSRSITTPDGRKVDLPSDLDRFSETDEPGIYEIAAETRPIRFAVNLSARESETAMLDVEQLSELGVQLGEHRTREEESEHQRQLRDIELESQQQLWRWLIVAVLGILGIETWLAGRKPGAQASAEGAVE